MTVVIGNCAWNVHEREFIGEDASAGTAGFAEAGEVGGEAVGDVHHGGGDAAADEGVGEGDGNARIEVRLKEGLQFKRLPGGILHPTWVRG